jgi:hypothetical protein
MEKPTAAPWREGLITNLRRGFASIEPPLEKR